MGRRGPKSEIEKQGLGDRILALKLAGNSCKEIGDTLGLDEYKVQNYLSKVKHANGKTGNNLLKTNEARELLTNQIRLEISQETALSELSDQLKEYTDQYDNAKDERSKYAWSQNRIKILQEMNKVTGMYMPKPTPSPDPAGDVFNMSDEELENKARAILERRKR